VLELAQLVLEVSGSKSSLCMNPCPQMTQPVDARTSPWQPSNWDGHPKPNCETALRERSNYGTSGDGSMTTDASAQSDSERPPVRTYRTLSVVMPVYNERATVAEIIRRMRAVEIPLTLQVIVVTTHQATALTRCCKRSRTPPLCHSS